MSFTVDFSDFDGKFGLLMNNRIPELAYKGLFQAGAALIRDAIIVSPFAPKSKGGGTLWRSQLIKGAAIGSGLFGGGISELSVGFNVVYAAYVHEGKPEWHWTLPGSGPNYLESKLEANRLAYIEIAANYVRDNGGG